VDLSFFFSGDGGNWTRVRKTRPPDIYERSKVIWSRRKHAHLRCPLSASSLDPKALFPEISCISQGTPTLWRLAPPSVGERGGQTWPL